MNKYLPDYIHDLIVCFYLATDTIKTRCLDTTKNEEMEYEHLFSQSSPMHRLEVQGPGCAARTTYHASLPVIPNAFSMQFYLPGLLLAEPPYPARLPACACCTLPEPRGGGPIPTEPRWGRQDAAGGGRRRQEAAGGGWGVRRPRGPLAHHARSVTQPEGRGQGGGRAGRLARALRPRLSSLGPMLPRRISGPKKRKGA